MKSSFSSNFPKRKLVLHFKETLFIGLGVVGQYLGGRGKWRSIRSSLVYTSEFQAIQYIMRTQLRNN